MRLLLVRTLFSCSFFGLWSFTARAQGDYSRFETVDVTAYRVRSSFILPVPPAAPAPATDPAQVVNLERYFRTGNKYYIDADPRLEALIKKHTEQNLRISSVPGFRLQVYAGSNREEAYQYKGALLDWPAYASYLDYEDPNYRVRLGDFLNREEAELALRKVKAQFPEAFIVSASVKPARARVTNNIEGN